MCDRISSSAKSRMKLYLNSGNDLDTPLEMKKGIEFCGGVKGVETAIIQISRTDIPTFTRIQDITKINNIKFNYEAKTITCFKAYNIGRGKEYQVDESKINSPCIFLELEGFSSKESQESNEVRSHISKSLRTFMCNVQGCISMFGTLSDKLLHETQNEHQFENDECLKNPKDKITVHFINTLLDSNGRKGIFENPCHTQPSTYNISSGWALKKSAPRKSIPADVKVKGTTSISSKLKSKRLQLFFIFYMNKFFLHLPY